MTTLVCNYQAPKEKPVKKQLTESRREQLRKRIEQQALKLSLAGSEASSRARRVEIAKKMVAHSMIDLHDMSGVSANRWTRFLAVQLGENFGETGKLRASFFENKRIAGGLIKTIENEMMHNALEPMSKRFNELVKLRGVDSANTAKLMTELFEVGRTPIDIQIHGKSKAVQELLIARNNNWVQDMLKAGFTEADIDELAALASRAGQAFDGIHVTLEALGKTLPQTENIEYLPRIFTREGQDWFTKNSDNYINRFKLKGAEVQADFAKVRNSVWYTPEDQTALAELLNIKEEELAELITDTAKFKAFLDEALDDEFKDMLVDAGIISRIPMTSAEMFEWYSTRYNLPFRSFDEVFVTDPKKILRGYTQELKTLAQNHGLLKPLKDQGVMKGILVDEATAQAEGLENFMRVRDMYTSKILASAGIDENLFIHKDAGKILDSAIQIERNPSALNSIARTYLSFLNNIKRQMLATPQYVSRIFLSDTLMYAAHGGEMHEVITSTNDLMKYMTRGLKAFDDVKPYRVIDGQTYTHRGFMQLFAERRLTDRTPMFDGAKRPTVNMNALNPLLAGKKIGLMTRMVLDQDTFPDMLKQLWKETGYVFSDWVKAINAPFAFSANFIETAFKLGLFKSVTKRGDGWDVLRKGLRYITTMEGGMYDDANSALQHVDRAFLTMDDMGEIPGNISRYLIPFFSFTWKSSSAIMRDAIRNPIKYMQYGRMAAMVYKRMEETHDISQGELYESLNNDMAIPVYVDDEGRAVFLTPTNVHPILGFFKSTAANVDKLARLLGIPMGTAEEVRDMLQKKHGIRTDGSPNNLAAAISDALAEIYATQIVGIGLGRSMTGRPINDDKYNTFLGIEMSQTTEEILGAVVPMLRTVNSYNPGGVFGEREEISGAGRIGLNAEGEIQYNEGETIRESQPSIFGTDRTDSDQKDLVNRVTKDPAVFIAQLAGLSFVYNDMTRNLKYTHLDLVQSQNAVSAAYKKLDVELKTGKLPERQATLARIRQQELLQLYGLLEYDRLRVEAYMREKGVTTREFDIRVRDKKLAIQGIPMLSLREQRQVLQAVEALENGNR